MVLSTHRCHQGNFGSCLQRKHCTNGTRIPDVSNVFGSSACPQRKMVRKNIRRFSPNGIVERYMRIKKFLKIKDEECLLLNLFRPARIGKLSLQYAKKYQWIIFSRVIVII